ncbi:Holliday junction resolvase RusA-like endonuclease [Anaerotaenia torta]|uniref:RusA family crossover junction endodeoxyribonuclease n=1 Tax=Anaerotaenia torta TaxID=433293 RepID=UPI003D1DCD49
MVISFTIPGPPQGKARARTTYHGTYTPEKTVLYENLIKLMYQQQTDYMSEKPLEVFIMACYEPPKSTSKKMREQMLSRAMHPTKKPDIDNIAKVVLDALNGVAYKDDTQVVQLTMSKVYSSMARVDVKIREVGD